MTGDNGLLQKAGEAKKTTETATALEKIQAEIAGSYGLDGKIDLNELNKNLKRVNGLKYNDADIVLDGENKNIIEELPAEVFIQKNSFFIDKNGEVLDWKGADVINSKIGNIVDGYSVADLQWQVFYSDPIETYLISKTLAKSSFPVPINRKKQNEDEIEIRKLDELGKSGALNWTKNNGAYSIGFEEYYHTATPGGGYGDRLIYVDCDGIWRGALNRAYYYAGWGVRPIVSIPTLKVSVNGNTVTVNP